MVTLSPPHCTVPQDKKRDRADKMGVSLALKIKTWLNLLFML